VIDASGSMLADDYTPNRLEAAKKSAIEFVDSLNRGTKVGIISFAGTSFLLQSLTEDVFQVKEAINKISSIKAGGTAIGDSLVLAVNTFKISENLNKGKSIVLLTDGRNNVGKPFRKVFILSSS